MVHSIYLYLSLDSIQFNSVFYNILLLSYILNESYKYIIYHVFNLVSNSVKYTNTCIYILEFTSCPGIHGTILLKFCCKSSYLGSLL